ncbi:ImmA/IrrE family metallo-endopeptidase [Ruminococcaceae bacterium OttesenSCG-928-A11]|nr:ImmA/IrrE family metallo-endopeptidase [Ruminococcaceae bacterium OttesenSCG-928-A11]
MKAETAVQRLVEKHATRNPFEICYNEGIIVARDPLGDIRGYYRRINTFDYIAVNSDLEPMAAVFACGHELAHWVFDKGVNRVFMDYCTHLLPDKLETRADRFAAHLLFGQPPLYQESITTWEMAEILNVPACNVDARLFDLGIYY